MAMAGHDAEMWQSAGYLYPAAHCSPTSGRPGCHTAAFPSNPDSSQNQQSMSIQSMNDLAAFTPISQTPGTADWHNPSYRRQSNSSSRQVQYDVHLARPGHDSFELDKPENFRYSHPEAEDFGIHFSQASTPSRDCASMENPGSLHLGWTPSPVVVSSYGEDLRQAETGSAISPLTHSSTPSPLGGATGIFYADSAYGSGSSQAESMMHATNYFACSEVDKHLQGNPQTPYAAPATRQQRPSLERAVAATSPPAHAEQTRQRQDAHSKVEKRYRMNINNKIEQLRRILPGSPPSGDQPLNHFTTSSSSKRRKCGTDLSKQDVLSMTLNYVEQLQSEIQDVTSQNSDLKEKIAMMRSLAAEE
jgi:Helix-loop-helix DNA-binding domain